MCGKLTGNDAGNAPHHFVSRRTFLVAGGIGLTGSVGSMMSRAAPSSSGGVTGETGTVTADQPNEETWRSVSLSGTYGAPVVVTAPLSYNGAQPAHVRLRNVSSNGFEFQIEEWGYLDGPHIDETLQYVAMEAGTYDLPNGAVIQAGTVETAEEFSDVSFQRSFSATPVVMPQSQTYNGSQPVVTRTESVTADGFDVRVQEAEWRGSHAPETVGYVAIDEAIDAGFEARRTADIVTDEWHRIDFGRAHESPVFVADLQTNDGPDTAGLRYRDLESSGVEVFVEEEQSADDENNHTTERVGYLVTTPGGLFGSGGGGGGDDGDEDARIIDDFGGGLAAYEGDTDQFTEQEAVVASGASALECEYSGAKRSIGSMGGLQRYPKPGETFRVAVGATNAASGPRIGFATQGTARSVGRYQVYADIERGELYFSRRDEAGWTTLASTPASLSSDKWYDIEVQWTANNEFTVGLYPFGGTSPIAEVAAADGTYTSGGIQMTTIGRGTDTTMYFDYWRVTDKAPTYGGNPEPEPEPEPEPDGPITGPVDPSNTGQGCGATPAPDTQNAVNAGRYRSIQAAIDAAASQGKSAVVVPSGTHREGKIRAKSGVALVGEDGAVIDSTAAESISIENVSDVHIHNLRVKANEQNAGRVIGSGSPGEIADITISDCTLSGNANGVSLRLMDDEKASNVTIRHCDISKVDRHGIFFGTDDVDGHPNPTGFIKSPTIVNNYVHDMYRWMGITLAGRETAQCSDGYVSGNYCDASMWSNIGRGGSGYKQKHDNWTNHGISFEEWVIDTVVEHNFVNDFQKSGIGCTGGARRNTFRYNEVIDSRMGIRCTGALPHPDDPTQNEFYANVIRNPAEWAVYNKESGGKNDIHDNRFIGNDRIYNERRDRFADNRFE